MAVNYYDSGIVPPKFWSQSVAVGEKYGVDPYLLMAIGKHETAYGTLGLGRKGLSMGYGAYDAGAVYTWQDKPGEYTNQLTAVAKKIKAQFQGVVSLDSLNAFGRLQPGKSLGGMPVGYASDPLWGQKVFSAYNQINKMDGLDKFTEAVRNPGETIKEGVASIKDTVAGGVSSIAGGAAYIVVLLSVAAIAGFSVFRIFGKG